MDGFGRSGIQPTSHRGVWTVDHQPPVNLTLRPYYPGDGFMAAATGMPYKVLVRALVKLHLPADVTVKRGEAVRFHGIVRPRQPGTSLGFS